jgi:hypothetical protein|tara:strand:+ start:68 stop:409 length:342 start_codon:yes stop_codon:yes gene_type:complete
MKGEARKAAIAAYKERRIASGVYALRFAGEDRVWVGAAKDLAGIENRQRFTMRTGGHPRRELQVAWNRHGEPAFGFEILETLDLPDDATDFIRASRLDDRVAHWRAVLAATPV